MTHADTKIEKSTTHNIVLPGSAIFPRHDLLAAMKQSTLPCAISSLIIVSVRKLSGPLGVNLIRVGRTELSSQNYFFIYHNTLAPTSAGTILARALDKIC